MADGFLPSKSSDAACRDIFGGPGGGSHGEGGKAGGAAALE
jgi:hypothetical protein